MRGAIVVLTGRVRCAFTSCWPPWFCPLHLPQWMESTCQAPITRTSRPIRQAFVETPVAVTRDVEAYTWVRPGIQGPAGRCWLKFRVPPLVKDACCDSGSRRVHRPRSSQGRRSHGPTGTGLHQLRNRLLDDVRECLQRGWEMRSVELCAARRSRAARALLAEGPGAEPRGQRWRRFRGEVPAAGGDYRRLAVRPCDS